jgi:hypothetical protein
MVATKWIIFNKLFPALYFDLRADQAIFPQNGLLRPYDGKRGLSPILVLLIDIMKLKSYLSLHNKRGDIY